MGAWIKLAMLVAHRGRHAQNRFRKCRVQTITSGAAPTPRSVHAWRWPFLTIKNAAHAIGVAADHRACLIDAKEFGPMDRAFGSYEPLPRTAPNVDKAAQACRSGNRMHS